MQTWTLTPEFELPVEQVYKTQQTPMLLGYVQTRAYWPRPKRIFKPRWQTAFDVDLWYADSFLRENSGPAGMFFYVPVDPISTPHRSGDASQAAGGAMSSRTYYYATSWVTAQGETTLSPTDSLVVGASNLFKLTVMRFLYKSVTKARIYVGTTAGTLTLQAEVTTSGGSWTELASGLVSGNAPPTANTAKETVTVHPMEDSFEFTKVNPVAYTMQVSFEEVF